MAGMMILGALAAFGALCTLWLLAGGLLPGGREGLMVYLWCGSAAGRGFAARWRVQWDLGLLRGRLAVVDLGMSGEDKAFLRRWCPNAEIWSPEDLAGLGSEREDGEGIGDHPGRDQRRGLSEL